MKYFTRLVSILFLVKVFWKRMKKPLIIHPFLLAIFPVLWLYARNMDEVSISKTFLPSVIILGFTILLFVLLGLTIKSNEKSGIIVSIFLLLFFSYGHILEVTRDWRIGRMMIGGNEYLLFAWGLLFVGGVYFIIRTRRDLHIFTRSLNIGAASLCLISLFNMGICTLKAGDAGPDHKVPQKVKANQIHLEKAAVLPNIYYIILDGYARADILKEIYRYDNSEFLESLIRMGFYLAGESRSNYPHTQQSLASALNLNYLDDLAKRMGEESKDRRALIAMIENNHVVNFLKQYGYTFVAFSSGYEATEIENADIYLNRSGALSEFDNILIGSTPLPGILQRIIKKSQHDLHRERILYIFDHLADSARENTPVFVFAHIPAPHPPFVFGEQGEKIAIKQGFSFADGDHYMQWYNSNKYDYIDRYKKQLTFINRKIKIALEDIILNSPRPPIIILQSDHGPGSRFDYRSAEKTNLEERMSILNAYYLPNNGDECLYAEITPVNTFRVVFNHYFGTHYELLNDENYFVTIREPYKFIEVTGKVDME